jgi:hypothetical protein
VKRRLLIRLTLFLVLGTIVNVAVAWGCANIFGDRWMMHVSGSAVASQKQFLASTEQGWPMVALTLKASESAPAVFRNPIVVGKWELAWHPRWPGFAINTVFYAGVLWLLFAAPFALRRRRRTKRGLCPKCAYPVGSSEVCTECGAALPCPSR